MIPGEVLVDDGDIELSPGRERVTLRVVNTGDRPIQVGSHTHFFEVNRALHFEREAAYGRRLDVPAGTALRFEPGESHEVTLVDFAGKRRVFGMNGLVQGSLKEGRHGAFEAAQEFGFTGSDAAGETL